LKEHSFFNPIDWKALAQKQLTPPFKPVVESDESVSNFDPEFTTANLNDTGVGDYLDDDDPSEEWVARSVREGNGIMMSGVHMPNGPLGSDLKDRSTTQPSSKGIDITKKNGAKKVGPIGRADRKGSGDGKDGDSSPPLTSSIQEKFIGFTYSGEDAGSLISQAIGKLNLDGDNVVSDEDVQEPTTEDEMENDAAPAGRYAQQRRRKVDIGVDDEF
jgi:serine/threonine protein kinase SCH9